MNNAYLVSEWALIRRNELVNIPDQLEIHPDFLRLLSHEEFESAFKEIGELFYQIYSDMADSPWRFGLPLYQADEYDYFSNQAREARTAPWNLFYFMFCIFTCGTFKENVFVADTTEIKQMNKAKKNKYIIRSIVRLWLCI